MNLIKPKHVIEQQIDMYITLIRLDSSLIMENNKTSLPKKKDLSYFKRSEEQRFCNITLVWDQ